MQINSNLGNENVVVLLLGFNRPELVEKRINELAKMRICHLYISIDGGSKSSLRDIKNIISNARKQFLRLETFEILLHKNNLGITQHITVAMEKTFEKFEYTIVVEDDIVLSENFYINMLHGFKTQKFHNLKGIVSAFSPLELSKFNSKKNKWRTTPYVPIWGWGCSSDIWQQYTPILPKGSLENTLSASNTWQDLNQNQKKIWLNRFRAIQLNPRITWDIQLQFHSFLNDYQNLAPVSRFIDNEGFFDSRAAHTKGERPRWLGKESFHEAPIISTKILKNSRVFSKIIDSNTYAGDSNLFKVWQKFRL
jgi:hypothetical protein